MSVSRTDPPSRFRQETQREHAQQVEWQRLTFSQVVDSVQKDMRSLQKYFTDSNAEMKRMNRVTYHSRKCVMSLQNSDSSTGSAAWFMKLWAPLSFQQKQEVQRNIEQTQPFEKGDFHVSVRPGNECPVVFYLLFVLQPLVLRTFTAHHTPSMNAYPIVHDHWQQALHVLHNPSLGNNEYRDFISLAYDKYVDFGDPLLRMPLSASTKLSALSDLLTQLQGLGPQTKLEAHSHGYQPRIHVTHNDIHGHLRELQQQQEYRDRMEFIEAAKMAEKRQEWYRKVKDQFYKADPDPHRAFVRPLPRTFTSVTSIADERRKTYKHVPDATV